MTADPHPDRPFVTVVSGVPRSGTSMMMRMLVQGGIPALVDDLRPADDDNPRGYFEYAPAKAIRKDASWVPSARGKAVKMVYALLRDLPCDDPRIEYRVVLMRRRLEEVVASQRVMLDRRGASGGPLDDEQLMAIFRRDLNEIETWAASESQVRLLSVRYNELMAEPGPGVAQIAEFLGGGLDAGAMAAVIEPELYRQRL